LLPHTGVWNVNNISLTKTQTFIGEGFAVVLLECMIFSI